MGFRERLAKMSNKAKVEMKDYVPGGFSPLPDDDYTFKVQAVLEDTAKAPARMQVKWIFTVIDGDLTGKQSMDWTIIEDNKVGLHICRDRLEHLGYSWPEEELGSIEDIVHDITERTPRIQAATKTVEKDGYTNTRFTFKECLDPFTGEDAVPSEKEQAPEEEVVSNREPEDPDHIALLNLCISQGVEGITDDMPTAEIITGLNDAGIFFPVATLTQDEINMLLKTGGKSLILGKIPGKTAAPAIVKKSAPAIAKKPIGRR